MTAADDTGGVNGSSWVLVAPTTGSHSLTFTAGASASYDYIIYSFYNAKQTSQPDSHAQTAAVSNSFSRTLVLSADSCVGLGVVFVNSSAITQTDVVFTNNQETSGGLWLAGITAPVFPASTKTFSGTLAGSVAHSQFTVGIAPFTTPIPAVKSTSASTAATSNTFIGFALASAAAASPVTVMLEGEMSGFSSLVFGTQYYLSNTTGLISSTAGSVTRKVGIATSTTALLITNTW